MTECESAEALLTEAEEAQGLVIDALAGKKTEPGSGEA